MTTDRPSQPVHRLSKESSPYLLQHARNPVDWFPWGDEALEMARQEDRLLIISIGYAACHWCHVMERESFEDPVVAVKMNANYVSVKVDREERPDIDQIYMNAAYIITGRGGWPLNAIALPDGRPVFAGTYFPKEQWLRVLDHFSNLWKNERSRMEQQAEKVTTGIRRLDGPDFSSAVAPVIEDDLHRLWDEWKAGIDPEWGGRQGAPKFMMPDNWDYLMRYGYLTGRPEPLDAVKITLDRMASGGLYDPVGGGFARYSTDEKWFAPHFEKMLYDNAQLIGLYARADQVFDRPLYRQVVEETIEFMERTWSDPAGGFYSSLDADSEGEEGKYYVWTAEELRAVWNEDYPLLAEYFSVRKSGNWEKGQNILFRQESDEAFAARKGMDTNDWRDVVRRGQRALFEVREKRIAPGLDDKVLTSWTALAVTGLADAFAVYGKDAWRDRALKAGKFLRDACRREDGGLHRNYKNGRSSINGFLDDYAHTIRAFIRLYSITFDESWIDEATALTAYTLEHFSDTTGPLLFYTSKADPALISRSRERSDNVIAASNSSMARVLLDLGLLTARDGWTRRAGEMLGAVRREVLANGPFYSNWAILATYWVWPAKEVVITGPDREHVRAGIARHYLPQVLLAGGTSEDRLPLLKGRTHLKSTRIFVCEQGACHLPVYKVSDAIKSINL